MRISKVFIKKFNEVSKKTDTVKVCINNQFYECLLKEGKIYKNSFFYDIDVNVKGMIVFFFEKYNLDALRTARIY